MWQEISQPLTRLGIPQNDIDEIKVAPLSPEEESYIKQLKEWKERDKDTLLELKDEVRNLKDTLKNLLTSQPEEWKPTCHLPDNWHCLLVVKTRSKR